LTSVNNDLVANLLFTLLLHILKGKWKMKCFCTTNITNVFISDPSVNQTFEVREE